MSCPVMLSRADQLCYQELSSYANRIFFSEIHNKKDSIFINFIWFIIFDQKWRP